MIQESLVNNAFCKLALVAALTCVSGAGHAFGDLSPGSGPIGAGNLMGGTATGSDPHDFYRDQAFYITWTDTSVDPSARFTDIVGSVGTVWRTASGLSPYEFSGVELYSLGSGNLLSTYSFAPGSDQATFTFGGLLEGGYSIRFLGTSIDSPDGWWPVNQWSYAFEAEVSQTAAVSSVASPAPEASQLAMSAMGLVAAVLWARRRKQAPGTPA